MEGLNRAQSRAPEPRLHAVLARGGRAGPLSALGAGAVSAFALPPFCLVPLLLFAFPSLLWLIGKRRTTAGAAWIGFCFGFGHHLVGLYWITEAILIEAAKFWWFVPIAVPALSAVLALFIAAAAAVAFRAPPGLPRILALAGAWTLFDLARQFVGTGFPWNPIGSVWAAPGVAGTIMLQPASLIGVHGLTLATIILACLPALGRRALAAGGVALLIWAGFGFARVRDAPTIRTDPNLGVVIAQGAIPEGHAWTRAFALSTFQRYIALTRAGTARLRTLAPAAPVLVVWPETASPFLLDTDAAARAVMTQAAGPGAFVLSGTIRFDAAGQPLNGLVVLDPQGSVAAAYDKWHLVPFGEYTPRWFPAPLRIAPGGFAFGSGPRTLHVHGLPSLGPLICYEAIFSHQILDEADRPALLVNITNDAWFGNSTGPRQHLAAARIRAIEEGLPLVRAANTGISALFDAHGREIARLGLDRVGALSEPVHVPSASAAPLFARAGLALSAALAVIALAAAFAAALLTSRRVTR